MCSGRTFYFKGFFGKFFLFTAAAEQGYYWLVLIAVINATISLYYYLIVVKAMFINKNDTPIAKIKSDNYSGPLEVLLDLAKSQKVNLTNISITQLADQFIEFINSAKKINLDLLVLCSSVFLINGKVCGAISRVPKQGSFLSNMSKGAKPINIKLTNTENKISKLIAKDLKKENIFFAGIDFIDQKLNGDINVTSPTGLKTLYDLSGINLAKTFWNELKV